MIYIKTGSMLEKVVGEQIFVSSEHIRGTIRGARLYIHTYIHSLLTTSPKGLFSANYKEEGKNKNIYKLFKVTIANH